MIKTLLCATDGSHASEKAAAVAADLAKGLGAKLTFLTVNAASAERTSKTYFWDTDILGAADAQIHQQLGGAARIAKQAGLADVDCVTASGTDIAAAIVSYAESHGFDHIITGSTGKKGAARLLLGSVAASVVARAHCAVTIAR